MLTFEDPPPNTDHTLTREEIGRELASRPGEWAVVARPDRIARAEALIDRIVAGTEYGSGFEATIRKLGGEIRVYARCRPARRRRRA